MSTLDFYLFRRMTGAIARTLAALVFLYILIDLLAHREIAISKYDVPADVVFRYYVAFAPQVLYRVAPWAILIAALMVLGDAAQNNEITAVLAGGISLRRFVFMPIVIAAAFATALFGFNETVGARGAVQADQIVQNYFSHNPDMLRKGISWANLSGGWTCHIRKFNRIALTGEDVLIHSTGEKDIQHVQARRIYWDETERHWMLEDGGWYKFSEGVDFMTPSRITLRPAPFEESPDVLFALDKPTETKSSKQLMEDILSAEKRAVPVGSLWVDYHAKFSQPALSFVMIWLAIPFALRLRRGGLAISFGASIAIATAYLLVFSAAMGLGYAQQLSPAVAAWAANVVFFATGLVLFWRTPT